MLPRPVLGEADYARLVAISKRFTESSARRSNDNTLVEGKNANVVCKWFGHDHITQRLAPEINRFAQVTLSPFLFATEHRDGNVAKMSYVYESFDGV